MKSNKIIATLLIGYSMIFPQEVAKEKYDILTPEIIVNDENIIDFEYQALKGNSYYLQKLLDYLRFKKYNYEELEFWELIAAENEEEYAAYNYSTYCNLESSISLRGNFWLLKDKKKENEDIDITCISDFYTLKTLAFKGSPSAAYKLSMICESNASEENLLLKIGANFLKSDNLEKNKIFWLRIGTQNGSKKCMKEYIEFLQESNNKYDNIRSEFWITKLNESTQ